MNNLDKQYQALLQDILDNGVTKQDRTGTGTLSTFGRQIRHKMSEGFPLLTTKKMYFKGIVTELLWFLRGDTNIKYLVDNDCHIWDGDAYQAYCKWFEAQPEDVKEYEGAILPTKEEFIERIKTNDEFSFKFGDLGRIYGHQWRKWETNDTEAPRYEHYKKDIDQIANLIHDLKTNPDSRRLMVNAWNVGELDQMSLPPCHYGFQVYTRELTIYEREQRAIKKYPQLNEQPAGALVNSRPFNHEFGDSLNIPTRAISLMWNQRSVDTFLGLPFNIASYGLLLEIIAKEVNMVPDELIGNLGDTHLYLNHIEQAKEQIGRELSLDERTELAKGIIVPLLGSKEDSYNEAGVPTRTREPFPLPTLVINDEFWNPDAGVIEQIEHIEISDFDIRDYQSHSTIKAPLSN